MEGKTHPDHKVNMLHYLGRSMFPVSMHRRCPRRHSTEYHNSSHIFQSNNHKRTLILDEKTVSDYAEPDEIPGLTVRTGNWRRNRVTSSSAPIAAVGYAKEVSSSASVLNPIRVNIQTPGVTHIAKSSRAIRGIGEPTKSSSS